MPAAPMAWLVAATLLVIASHALPSAPGLRQRLIRTLGRPGFHVAYSLISLLTLGLLIWAYQAVGPQPWLYAPSRAARVIAPAVVLAAIFLITARLTTPAMSDRAYGIYRVTAVPGSLGVPRPGVVSGPFGLLSRALRATSSRVAICVSSSVTAANFARTRFRSVARLLSV